MGFLLQAISIAYQFFQTGYPFILTSGDAYFLSAWILAAVFLLLTIKYPMDLAACLFLPAILILSIFAHFLSVKYSFSNVVMQSPWAAVHIVFAFLAFSVFSLCFIMSILFLFQEYQLKHKKMWSENFLLSTF